MKTPFRVGTYHVYQDASNEWRWRLVASNGQTIATSGEGYSSRYGCEHAIRSVRWNAAVAPIQKNRLKVRC